MDSKSKVQEMAKWIPVTTKFNTRFKCSGCTQEFFIDTIMGEPLWSYCPRCGSRMRNGAGYGH